MDCTITCTRVSIVRTRAYTYLHVEPYSINIGYKMRAYTYLHVKPYSI